MMRIAVIAYNYKLSCDACLLLAQEDMDSNIYQSRRGCITMQDGTIYQAISDESDLRVTRFSQLILVDDNRWEVFREKCKIINCLIETNLLRDADWQIQKYDWT